MAKRPQVSPSTRAYLEHKLACVDQKRVHPSSVADIPRLSARSRPKTGSRRPSTWTVQAQIYPVRASDPSAYRYWNALRR
jgi:hypothetical protein